MMVKVTVVDRDATTTSANGDTVIKYEAESSSSAAYLTDIINVEHQYFILFSTGVGVLGELYMLMILIGEMDDSVNSKSSGEVGDRH